jgi:HEXXH motif-containing protein
MDLIRLTSKSFDPEATLDLHSTVVSFVEQQMKAVLEKAGALYGPGLAESLCWEAIEGLSETERRQFFLAPPVRYWIKAMKRATSLGLTEWVERFAGEFASLVWTYGLPAASSGVVRLDGSGGLRVVENGRYIEFGASYANDLITIQSAGDGFEARLPDGVGVAIPREDVWDAPEEPLPTLEANGYRLYLPEAAPGFGLPITPRDPWLRSQLTGTSQRRDGMQFFPEDRPFSEVPATPLSQLGEVYQLLNVVWPDHVDEICTYVHRIVPLEPEEGFHRAYTVSSRQGVVYMAPAPTLALAEMLVHEVAHIKMRDIQVVDILMNDFDTETVRIKVPWREDPRPISGILEGLFVFTHVAEMEKRILMVADDAGLAAQFSRRLEALDVADNAVRQHADMTGAGKIFLGELAAWRSELQRARVAA